MKPRMRSALIAIANAVLISASSAVAQTVSDYQSAVRDAAGKYRGDVPTGAERRAIGEFNRERVQIQRTGSGEERADALRRYMERAKLVRPYLDRLEKTPPGPASGAKAGA